MLHAAWYHVACCTWYHNASCDFCVLEHFACLISLTGMYDFMLHGTMLHVACCIVPCCTLNVACGTMMQVMTFACLHFCLLEIFAYLDILPAWIFCQLGHFACLNILPA